MKLQSIPAKYILMILMIFFCTYFTFLAFSRHDNFYSRRLDLGNMDQTVWNVLHGNGFTLTDPTGDRQESRLAVHADYLLVLMAPLYVIWSNPKMLLLIQVVVSSLGVIPVYWIAYEKIRSKHIALLFSVIYLFYPPLQRRMLHDFHAVSLTTTFLLYAYWYMEKKRFALFVLFAILAALGKETVWLTVCMMGIYLLFWKKSKIIGLTTILVSLGIFFYLFWIAIPSVTPIKQHFALVYLSEYGDSLNGILKNILLNPFQVIRTFFLPDRLYYFFQILSPFGFLSLLSPFFLLFASESIIINTLSNNQLMRQIDYQYGSTIMPFIVISAISGYTIVQKLVKRKSKLLPSLLTAIFLVTVYLWGEFPIGKSQWFWFFITPLPEKKLLQQISTSVDSKYTVSVTNNIGAHFSQREYLYNYPINAQTADYTVVYLGDPYAWPSEEEQLRVLEMLKNNPDYDMIISQGKLFAFKKKSL